MTSLKVDKALKTFGTTNSVKNVSLELNPGTITVLLGGSGAGKSTLLRLIAGLETLNAGTIQFGNEVWADRKTNVPTEKRQVGLIFQDFALFPHMTVLENVRFGVPIKKRDKAHVIAKEWLARVELSDQADLHPNNLSGGERQRVALARTFASEPKLLLMDEPFSGLDPALRESIRDDAVAMAKKSNLATLLVTHDPRDAMIAADNLIIMKNGKIVQSGSPREVYHAPRTASVVATLSPINIFHSVVDEDSSVKTPVGTFLTSKYPVGANVKVVVREEAISFGARTDVTVIERRDIGSLVRLRLEAHKRQFSACFKAAGEIKENEQVFVDVDSSGVFIFLDENC